MTLSFPNDCRSFDSERKTVSFWGHDATLSALHHLSGLERLGEAAALRAFDANRTHIRNVAQRLYQKTPKPYWELSASDL